MDNPWMAKVTMMYVDTMTKLLARVWWPSIDNPWIAKVTIRRQSLDGHGGLEVV